VKTPAFAKKLLTDYFRYVAGAVALVVLAAGYFFVIAPTLSQVQTNQVQQRKTAEAELKTKQEYITALRQSNQRFATVLPLEQRQVIEDFLPSTEDFPGLLLTVKNVVTQSGLTMDSFSIGQSGQVAVASGAAAGTTAAKTGATPAAQAATVGGLNVKTQDITISVSGGTSYDSFKGLLRNFETSRRLFDVVSVSFTAAVTSATGGTTPATWNFVLRSYYLPIK
jgi:hypothetical protein